MLRAQLFPLDIWTGLSVGILTVIFYYISKVVYNVCFHPLSHFPGPLSHSVSRIPYLYKAAKGTLPFDMLDMHMRYGDIVRIAPDELAFSHPDAWKDIMGHRKEEKEMEKAKWFYCPIEGEPLHVVNAGQNEHRQLRRQLAHGFSEKSMRDQESIIRGYVNEFVHNLRVLCKDKKPVVISDWYNYTTFDIIGDLAFGEPFGCLKGSNYDTWIKGIFQSGRMGTILQALSFYPWLKRVLLYFVPRSMQEEHIKHKSFSKAKMIRRISNGEGRPDLIEGLIRKKDELNLTVEKLVANAEILIIGGSETTATLLSGVTYLLLNNPETYKRLTHEVRTMFHSEEEINLVSVNRLTYMLACLEEALRMYPPIANGLPQTCPKGGAKILGQYIPENTFLSIHQWALYRRPNYFTDPNGYHPERFLGDPRFVNDRRDALQPFHVGPRNCLGRNLAYSEMRLILALVIFNFDIQLVDERCNWIQQKNFLMWQKPPLKVYLTPAL